MRSCWCGATDLGVFNADYALCTHCGTLVSQAPVSDEQLLVRDDDHDFYGKQYWLKHQSAELGLPDIRDRARADLVERNLHWMRTLLRYHPPPARTLELGCAHGSFVALMRQAGYDASGVELSPWVVGFGRSTFGVPIDVGPLEDMEVAQSSLDVIVAMDVLEHLPDPMATMAHCLTRLKDGGSLLIQMPRFEIGMTYDALLAARHPFLSMLQPEEHLYLYSVEATRLLFARLGVHHLVFEPAIFDQYDLCCVASRQPLSPRSPDQGEAALASTPNGLFVRALLDLSGRENSWRSRFHEADADREARGLDVAKLTKTLAEAEDDREARGHQVAQLTATLLDVEKDREARGADLAKLEALVRQVEDDRAARGEQIEALSADVVRIDADRTARGLDVLQLTKTLAEAEGDRQARGHQVEQLTATLLDVEKDREARGQHVEQLTATLLDVERDRVARGVDLAKLAALLKQAEADRTARGQQVDALTAMVKAAEVDRAGHAAQLEQLANLLADAEADRAARLRQIVELSTLLEVAEADRHARGHQIETLTALLQTAELDRAARGTQIEELTRLLSKSHGEKSA